MAATRKPIFTQFQQPLRACCGCAATNESPAIFEFRLMLLNYFAYGSNLHPSRLYERVGESTIQCTAVLANFSMRFSKLGIDGSGKCNLHYEESANTIGVVYRLTAEQANRLEHWEATTCGYERLEVRVIGNGEQIQAFTFQALGMLIRQAPPPFEWYLEYVRLGAAHHEFPREYQHQLAIHPFQEDSDTKRAHKNELIMRRLRGSL